MLLSRQLQVPAQTPITDMQTNSRVQTHTAIKREWMFQKKAVEVWMKLMISTNPTGHTNQE